MISDALDYVKLELQSHLNVDPADIAVGPVQELSNDNRSGIRIALINIGQESSLRNMSRVKRDSKDPRYQEPPVYLNCHLMFAFGFSSYQTSLAHLAKTIELFQRQRFFDASLTQASATFPAGLDRIIFDLETLKFEQLNHVWAVLGGNYLPSIIYKMRLIKVQADDSTGADNIRSIQLDSEVVRQ